MNYLCVPNLPFWETVYWFIKVIGANLIIAFSVIVLIGVFTIIADQLGWIKL